MFERILFPTDGSEGAHAVFEHVLDIAAGHGATVHVLNVADTTRDSVTTIRGEVLDTLETAGESVVDEAAERASARGIETVTAVLQGEPYATILDYADAREVDLVVMPTRGRRGLERLLLGSTTERVVRRAEVPVLTVRPDDVCIDYPYRNVLVPTDGSDCAGDALAVSVDVAGAAGGALHLVSVVDVASLGVDVRTNVQMDSLEARAEQILADAATVAEEGGVDTVAETVEYGPSVHRAVLDYVEDDDVDLVVVGTHGRTGFDRYALGSVTEKLVRTAPVPVLAVRGPDEDAG